jgi:hypothetical protein
MPDEPLSLQLLPGNLAVCRLEPDGPVPDWATQGPFYSVTRTADEFSVVCTESAVPEDVKAERGWRILQVGGSLDFALTGVLARLTAPLAEAGVSIFALSTFDTDYLLVRDRDVPAAVAALRAAGHSIVTDADS